jgi:hypothetical protein
MTITPNVQAPIISDREGVCSLYSSVHQSTDFEPVKVQETLELTA